jgi:hypothetical protein
MHINPSFTRLQSPEDRFDLCESPFVRDAAA